MYNDIKNKLELNDYDYIINACDPDREGQAIFQYVYDHMKLTLPIKRFWTNDLTESAITNALNNLRYNGDGKLPNLENLTKASMLRGKFDWLIGMNLTVAASLQMGTTAKTGRVKTPTLAMIVQRELEIRNFKPETTYELEASYQSVNGNFPGVLFDQDGNVRFKTEKDADGILGELGKTAVVESITKSTSKTSAPNLYKLSDLQIDASKTLGFGADKTLELTQSLYEKKFVSYPRTDNRCISSALAKEFPKLLASVACHPDLKEYATAAMGDASVLAKVAKDKKYVDDAKLAQSGHYAIVPTVVNPNFNILSPDEKDLLTLVYKRFLSIFLPPLVEDKTVLVTNNNGHTFKTNGKVLVDRGYTVLYNTSFNDVMLPVLKKGDVLNVDKFDLKAKTTTPPPRYSDGTLVNAMDNPVKFLTDTSLKSILKEKHGIGTEATRANIIKELVDNNYIEKKGKGKVEYIYATEKGISIIENLKGKDIISVDMTGIWEEKLSQVEQGIISSEVFERDMVAYVLKSIEDIQNSKMRTIVGGDLPTVGTCPKCKRAVKEGKNTYFCSGYSKEPEVTDACDFILSKNILGAKLTATEVKKLLNGKPTKELTFKKANGDTWKSPLSLSDTGELVFGTKKNKGEQQMTELNITCPVCGGKIIEKEKGFFCENSGQNGTCTTAIWKESNGATYDAQDVEILLSGGTVEKKNTWRSGKTSTNKMKFENGRVTAIFEAAPKTSAEVSYINATCPTCGGKIVEKEKGFFCENQGCNTAIWKSSFTGATYDAHDAEILLSGGTVEKQNTWSSGKTSTNKMKYENGKVSAIFD